MPRTLCDRMMRANTTSKMTLTHSFVRLVADPLASMYYSFAFSLETCTTVGYGLPGVSTMSAFVIRVVFTMGFVF